MSTQDATAQASPIHQAGYIIDDRFQLIRVIGEGGMGSVFLARQLQVDRDVVVKVLKPELCNNDEQVERFKREAMLACKLKHPNSVLTYDFGIDQGVPYIVMEYLEGVSLADLLHQRRRLGVEETVKILTQVCLSLREAHDKGMVHRDLKPENIHILNEPERPNLVKVLDFGIAKLITSHPDASKSNLTKGDIIFGTPQYMAPEQIRGKDLDARADIYSLGVILYQCLTGRLPYDSSTVVDILTQHLTQPIPTPTLDDMPALTSAELKGFNQLLRMSMAKRPDERITDVMTLISELEEFGRLSTPAPAPNSAPSSRGAPPQRPVNEPIKERSEPKRSRGSRLGVLILLILITAVLVLVRMPELAPGGEGWEAWGKKTYEHHIVPLLGLKGERSTSKVMKLELNDTASELSMAEEAVEREVSASLGAETSDVFQVDELVEEASLSEEAQLIEEAQPLPDEPQLAETHEGVDQVEATKTDEPQTDEPQADEPQAEEPQTKAQQATEAPVKPWTLIIKSRSQDEVKVLVLKDKTKRPLKTFTVRQGKSKALRVHPEHTYKVICQAEGQAPKGTKVMGRSGEVKRVTCY